jgi:hypothetical protein
MRLSNPPEIKMESSGENSKKSADAFDRASVTIGFPARASLIVMFPSSPHVANSRPSDDKATALNWPMPEILRTGAPVFTSEILTTPSKVAPASNFPCLENATAK